MQPSQPRPKKLLDQVREVIRVKHYSYCTEETYVQWIRRYILFHDKRHPKDMGVPEIEAFLTHLAVTQQVSAATQNQALYQTPDGADTRRSRLSDSADVGCPPTNRSASVRQRIAPAGDDVATD